MSESAEIIKCYKPNNELPLCRQCQRKGESKTNEYETFNIRETRSSGWVCDGYISYREKETLF